MSQKKLPRSLNARSFALGLVSLTMLAVWSHWHNVISINRTSLNDNSPPVGGVGIFLGVFVIILLFELVFRRLGVKFRLPRGELIVIYAMLMVGAPWMGHGIWYRFVGLVYTIPRDTNQARLFHHYSDKLWPHGPQLNRNKDFEEGFEGYVLEVAPTKDEEAAPATLGAEEKRVQIVSLEGNKQKLGKVVQLQTSDVEVLHFKVRIPTEENGEINLVPGENYLLSYLVSLREAKGSTMLTCYGMTEQGDKVSINSFNRDTRKTFSAPSAFDPVTRPKILIPDRLGEYLDLVFEFRGAGVLQIGDIRFYNNEAIQSLYQGRTEIAESKLEKLPPNERARVDARPDSLLSPKGIAYRLRGGIPLRQWMRPALLWGSMILVLFMGLMALMVIMRHQWAENERFSFPMLIFPRTLLEKEVLEDGTERYAIFHKKAMWVGFGVACVLIFGHAMRHYFKFPMFRTQVDIASFVSNNRPLYSYFRGFYWHPFNISLLVLPIAFFIELELLGSILLCFFVCSLPFYLREEMFTSWKSVKDFPFVREQHTGAYLALAVLTIYAARQHFVNIFKKAFMGRKDAADDSNEAWTYRKSIFILLGSLLFLGFWTQYVDVGFWKGILYFGFIIAIGLSTARIRTECGTPWSYLTPYTPLIIFSAFGGAYMFGTDMFVIMIVSGGFLCSASYLMCVPTQVEMLQLGKLLDIRPRCLSRGMVLGALGGLILGGMFLLSIAYGKGAMNVPYIGDWAANQSFQVRIVTREVAFQDQRYQKWQDDVAEAKKEGGEKVAEIGSYGNQVQKPYAWAVGLSFVVTILLFVAKTLWVNFPLHPVGYILANTYFINMVWGSLFTAMLIKFISLKAGGVMFVRKTMTPFFVGLFLGTISSYLFWDAIALILNVFGFMDTYHVNHVI